MRRRKLRAGLLLLSSGGGGRLLISALPLYSDPPPTLFPPTHAASSARCRQCGNRFSGCGEICHLAAGGGGGPRSPLPPEILTSAGCDRCSGTNDNRRARMLQKLREKEILLGEIPRTKTASATATISNSFGMRCYSFFCLIGRQKNPRFSIRLLRVVVRPRLRCSSKQVYPNSVQHFLIAKISLGNSLSPRLPIKRSSS